MARESRIVLGLNSGTSVDGVDAVACEISGCGLGMRVRYIGHVSHPYESALRTRLLAAMAPARTTTEEICRLETTVGEAFAECAAAAVKKLGLRRLSLVGSHGQTICHLPPSRQGKSRGGRKASLAPGTLQIGDASIIAARVRRPVVHRFRQADMAVGGQGAPLVPWTDYVLFGGSGRTRIVQNIGGIANLTYLPRRARVDRVIAFDTGPGNMVVDALVQRFSKGRKTYDRDGKRAAKGTPDGRVLAGALGHRYFGRPPPKSCGREEFGMHWVDELVKRFRNARLSADDWIATATMLTACAMGMAYSAIAPDGIDEVIVCGGGAKNLTLLRYLAELPLPSARVGMEISTTEDYGIPIQAKEGLSFAMLAAACVDGVPANLPQVTGARHKVVLGQICDIEGRWRRRVDTRRN